MASKKRGQITVFIILGLIMLVVISITIYLKGEQITAKFDPEIKKKLLIDKDITPLQKYIESCLKQVTEPLTKELAKAGGVFEPTFYRDYQQQKINYLCLDKKNHCENTFLTKQEIEQQLAQNVNQQLDKCIDLNLFRNQGFNVETEQKTTEVSIKDDTIFVVLKYPIILKKNNLELHAETFTKELSSSFGTLLKITNHILNTELQQGHFDQIEFMKQHNDIIIEKHKPYPDIIYSIKSKDLVFNFGLQGHDTVSEVGYSYFRAQQQTGCCYNPKDNFCYKNTNPETCTLKQGFYDADTSCTCNQPETAETTIIQGKDCKNKKHLSAWCEYEGVVDNGRDFVGSQHYLYYCVDGKEYVEECRDYREEYCGENKETGKAACTVNRWQDCSACKDEACCLDANYRDCSWNMYETTNKCSPRIAPGFKFWGANAIAICTKAHETKFCDGFSCQQTWIDQTALICAKQGDCGNWVNVNDVLTRFGFINTDLGKKVDNKVYEQEINHEKTKALYSDFRTTRAILQQSTYKLALETHTQLLSAMMSYIDELGTIEVSDFLNPFVGKPLVDIKDIALCGIWQAPFGDDDCNICNNNKLHPCTEYKCKSFGQLCEFEEKNGVSRCFSQTIDDNKPPEIIIPEQMMNNHLKVTKQTATIEGEEVTGYIITPSLTPFEITTFSIKTDEPTKCKIAFTPLPSFTDIPNFNPTTHEFDTEHNITFTAPESAALPQKALDILNLTNMEQVTELILQPKQMLEQYKERYKTALFLYKTFNGNDLTKTIDPFVNNLLDNIKHLQQRMPFAKAVITNSLNKLEQNMYVVYLKCIDKAGNENKENIFIEFSIDTAKNDTIPPKILALIPENNSLIAAEKNNQEIKLFTNEFATCKYDKEDETYDEMNMSFSCASSKYDVASEYGGSYACSTTMEIENNEEQWFIRCRDHPLIEEQYQLKIEKGDNARVIGITENPYVNISKSNSILFALSMIKNNLTFVITSDKATVTMYKPKDKVCKYSLNEQEYLFDDCKATDKIHLGSSECNEEIIVNNNSINIPIICKEGKKQIQNAQEQSYNYVLRKSSPLEIIYYDPKGEINVHETELIVKTSESNEVSCSYKPKLSISYVIMDKKDQNTFTTMITNLQDQSNRFMIRCEDSYGNIAEKEIEIFVISQ